MNNTIMLERSNKKGETVLNEKNQILKVAKKMAFTLFRRTLFSSHPKVLD